jgi:Ca-activated chloride channel family protein
MRSSNDEARMPRRILPPRRESVRHNLLSQVPQKFARRQAVSWRAALTLLGVALCLGLLNRASANPAPAPTPDDALNAYRKGRFRDSQDEYSTLAKEKPDDARLRFNAGAAAYRQNDLTNAANWFESVLAAPDLELQQKAYYNLGNTRFRLGEALPDPQGRQRLWQEALTNFTAATKLNTADTNAAANYAFVRQKLEELQKQMPPPQQQQQQQKDQKDQKDKKDQNNKDQSQQQSGDNSKSQQNKNDQDNSPSSANKQQSKDSQQGQQEKDGQDSKSGESPQSGAKDDQSGQEGSQPPGTNPSDAAQQAGNSSGSKPDGQNGAAVEAGEGKPGEMSPAQAVQLLENQKGDEKALLLRAYGNGKEAAERAARVKKPW